MGRSITCNFHVAINVSNGKQSLMGAMSLKDIKGAILSEIEYQKDKGNRVVNAEVFSQTKTGERYMKGHDYFIMDVNGNIDYYNIGQSVPFYCF